MPSLIFVEKHTNSFHPDFVHNLDVVTGELDDWSPNTTDLMTLSRDELVKIASPVTDVKAKDSKMDLTDFTVENWVGVFNAQVSTFKEKRNPPSDDKGYSGGSGGSGGDQEGDGKGSHFPDVDDDDGFQVLVQKTRTPVSFTVSAEFNGKMLRAVVAQHWSVKMSAIRIVKANGLVDDALSLNLQDIGKDTILQAFITGTGGASESAKRSRDDSSKDTLSVKEIRQNINDLKLQLEGIQNPSPVITETLQKVRFIQTTVNGNPKQAVSLLMAQITNDQLNTLIVGTIPSSTRVGGRASFITTQCMADLIEKIDDLIGQQKICTNILVYATRLALSSPFAESNAHLPKVRMPLQHVHLAMTAWFSPATPPTLQDLGQRLGYSGQTGCLKRLLRTLLVAEQRCALATQARQRLSGVVEIDGTSLRLLACILT